MSDNSNSYSFYRDETVPTNTIGAAFILAVVLGLIVVSGVLLKPYETREVVQSLHEKIMMEKEYRELSRMSYSGNKIAYSKVAYSKVDDSAFPESNSLSTPLLDITLPLLTSDKTVAQKTDRAQSFDRDLKSEEYWKSLHASVAGIDSSKPDSAPVVLPPVVVGSAE